MIKLLKKQSFVLFLFFSCSFFSCEQLLEVIKPTPPKNQNCRLIQYQGYDLLYDNTGKVITITDIGEAGATWKLDYNAKGQITKGLFQGGYQNKDAYLKVSYNQEGKLSKVLRETADSTDAKSLTEYAYRGDTVVRTVTAYHTYTGDTVIVEDGKSISTFENGNLVRVDFVRTQYSIPQFIPGFITYEYSQTPNKLYEIKNQLTPILDPYEFQSKMLPSKFTLYQGEKIADTFMYEWILNEQGYPINNGRYPAVTYKYDCK